ncbi:MAG: hypothetical protein WCE79_17800 [Xanthobacteraceae bacterium]
MKKKLVSACLLFAGVIAFSPIDANARPHKHHPAVHRATHSHRVKHHVHRRGKRVTRRARAHVARAGGRPRAWCGWWLGNHLGIANRNLWLARNWASVGRNSQPGIGVVVVWRHHVGIITGRAGGKWIVKSGNDGNTVRERPRSIAGAIAFRGV